jgi:hypothetical protein
LLRRIWSKRLLLAGATAAAVAIAAVLIVPPGDDGNLGFSTAEAVVIEGSLAGVTPSGVTLQTSKGPQTFKLGEGAILQDGFGNTLDLSALRPGQIVVLTARPSDGALVPQRVEIKDRLFGTLTSVIADSITVQTKQALYLVLLSPETEVEGRLAEGVFVEVEVERLSDGSFRAEEVEVEDEHEDEDGDGSGPGGGDSRDDHQDDDD